jgi:hypothetical protein
MNIDEYSKLMVSYIDRALSRHPVDPTFGNAVVQWQVYALQMNIAN